MDMLSPFMIEDAATSIDVFSPLIIHVGALMLIIATGNGEASAKKRGLSRMRVLN